MAEIAVERADILNVFNQQFPDYLALSKPQPLTLETTEALLDGDEAVVALHIGEKHSYAWVVTNADGGWFEIPADAKTLGGEVAQLRQSLTFTADRPFDTALAYKIYQETFGPIAEKIAGKKRLSVLANGALTSIPVGLLVASDPSGKSLKDLDWLIKSHAITVLPSIFSLKTMRARARSSSDAPKPMIAFADPVFSQQARAEAKTARVTLRSLASFYQGSQIDVRALGEALPQLPRTRDEVRRVGAALGAGRDDLKLGLDATVTAVEHAPLNQYRVVYFATHGLVAGDLAKFATAKAEPALVLTIPDNPTEDDNGLLTASAVAQLKLNADWVVLSACNTASSDGVGADALSGLARAFIYAGARSLVVSNWEISDEATAYLMTNLFEISSKNAKLSHGEAMQQATLRLLASAKTDDDAHPRVWAPFMVVGEPAQAK